VEISIRKINNCLQLSLSDDGVGFDTQKVYSGNGLKNLRQRAETIGGELKIRSDHGKGTDIILKINIP
jgi:signal transduction histidine kinase